jgi:hypothetical protein
VLIALSMTSVRSKKGARMETASSTCFSPSRRALLQASRGC